MQPINPFSALVAAVAEFAIVIGPAALGVTLVVDFIRNHLDPAGTKFPKVIWQYAALVVGIVVALAFQLNYVRPIVDAIPALASGSSHLLGSWGRIFTGIGLAGASTYWHGSLNLKKAQRVAAEVSPTVNTVP